MPQSVAPESVLPVDWIEVLHTVELTLEQAIAEARQRECQLPAAPLPQRGAPDADPAWQQGLQRLHERLRGLQAVVRQAEQSVAEVDAILGTEEAALRQWRTAVERHQQKLAEGSRPEV